MLLEEREFGVVEFLLRCESILLPDLQAMFFGLLVEVGYGLFVLLLIDDALVVVGLSLGCLGSVLVLEGVKPVFLPCSGFLFLGLLGIVGYDGCLCCLV